MESKSGPGMLDLSFRSPDVAIFSRFFLRCFFSLFGEVEIALGNGNEHSPRSPFACRPASLSDISPCCRDGIEVLTDSVGLLF